jgi:hypothetical protein
MGDTWAPREGAYGRTRDGQRVGPLTHDPREPWPGAFWRASGGPVQIRGLRHPLAWWHAGCYYSDGTESPLDLVAEWTEDGPVRTVTRREIVPGTYGLIVVRDGPSPTGNRASVHVDAGWYSADELDAAARVLTELAGALRNG